jgi:uncharacterized protein (DUF2147 family)
MRVLALTVMVLMAAAAVADERVAVMGRWASDGSILEVAESEGSLTMTIVALLDPLYLESDDYGEPGQPKIDRNNPDESLRGQPILGLQLLSDYEFDGKWQGKIYDPESGKVYSSNMRVDDGQLLMRGYIGAPMFGRTQRFEPVVSCVQHIVEMLKKTGLDGCQ